MITKEDIIMLVRKAVVEACEGLHGVGRYELTNLTDPNDIGSWVTVEACNNPVGLSIEIEARGWPAIELYNYIGLKDQACDFERRLGDVHKAKS